MVFTFRPRYNYGSIHIMVKNNSRLKEFEDNYISRNKPDILSNLQLLDSLYEEARALSAFPLREPLVGLKMDIKIAKVINSVPIEES
jgi:hypothetical protein